MGMLRRMFGREDVAAAPQAPESTLGKGDVLPAEAPTMMDDMKANANLALDKAKAGAEVALDKATDVYRRNPKLVVAAGLVAAAAAAGAYAAMKRRRTDVET